MFGQRTDTPSDRDSFIYEIAISFREPGLCQKITPYAEGGEAGWARPGYQISYLQSNCYLYLAASLPDPSLCDKVRPLRKGFLDGSKMTPEFCRSNRVVGGAAADGHVVVAAMRRLGYLDQQIREFQYRNLFSNPIHAAYDQLRQGSEFAERIESAPNFAEPFAAGRSRAANDLEYLYDVFAVDSDNSAYCGKISPNAAAELPSHGIVPIRLECYNDVAFNTRNVNACDKLPTEANLPAGARNFRTRESCSRSIVACRRPDLYRSGPEFPPTFSSFQNALHEIGYDPIIPGPTYTDYEDFLRYLSHSNPSNVSARAEFLRRVASMN